MQGIGRFVGGDAVVLPIAIEGRAGDPVGQPTDDASLIAGVRLIGIQAIKTDDGVAPRRAQRHADTAHDAAIGQKLDPQARLAGLEHTTLDTAPIGQVTEGIRHSLARRPPSTLRLAPVTNAASSLAR